MKSSYMITIACEEVTNIHIAEGVPQLHFDQLNAIVNHIHAIQTEQDKHWDPITPTSMDNTQLTHQIV